MTQSQFNLHSNSAQKAQLIAPDVLISKEHCRNESSDNHTFNLMIDEYCTDASSSLSLLTHRIEDVGEPYLNKFDPNSMDTSDSLMEAILFAAEECVEYHLKRKVSDLSFRSAH